MTELGAELKRLNLKREHPTSQHPLLPFSRGTKNKVSDLRPCLKYYFTLRSKDTYNYYVGTVSRLSQDTSYLSLFNSTHSLTHSIWLDALSPPSWLLSPHTVSLSLSLPVCLRLVFWLACSLALSRIPRAGMLPLSALVPGPLAARLPIFHCPA